ncbi:hypothetical protein ACVMHR_008496 [Bradyrhizobium diazoefficiens]
MTDKADMRIESGNALGRALDLVPADIGRRMDHLALEVGQRHHVVIDHAERADPGGSQIHQGGRAEPAGADHQHGGPLQRGLARAADVAQHDMAGITFEFVRAQHSQLFLDCCRSPRGARKSHILSFRGDAKHRTRNLEIPGLALRAAPE